MIDLNEELKQRLIEAIDDAYSREDNEVVAMCDCGEDEELVVVCHLKEEKRCGRIHRQLVVDNYCTGVIGTKEVKNFYNEVILSAYLYNKGYMVDIALAADEAIEEFN